MNKNKALNYRVELGVRSYDIHIEPGCLNGLGIALADLFAQVHRCVLVSNERVDALYGRQVRRGMADAGLQCTTILLPDGERHKDLAHLAWIFDGLMREELSRNEPLVALGGGVVGDMVGFAAACYRRGIPYVQVPTTLLAQVDSSVGGKTAVNHPLGKNMIGAFYQPRLVWIDPRVLSTLPDREYRAGLAEVVKYGLIRDASFFAFIERNIDALMEREDEVLVHAIYRSCQHKAEIVSADETEHGVRALLNLGHTFGHALEAMTRYRHFLHGEAVAIGIVLAARLSERLGYAEEGIEDRISALFDALGLPTDPPRAPFEHWMASMAHDKKSMGARLRFVLLKGIGKAFLVENVPEVEIRRLLDAS